MSEARIEALVRERLDDGEALVRSMLDSRECVESIAAAAELIGAAAARGAKVLLFGNGGSAADAVHIAAEFVGRYLVERRPLPALALNANISAITAIGNDYGFDRLFSRQVAALGAAGDVAIGLTTSGRSPNVVAGLAAARERGLTALAMTGADPGPVGAEADLTIAIPSTQTPRIQEGHMLAAHTICEWVEVAIGSGEAPG